MSTKYNHKQVEKKWQKYWENKKLHKTPKDATHENKFYILPQLPYPSGDGLHVGHAEVYSACDIYARYKRMTGKKVLQVIGWDSFGLPAENYAIKTNVHPRVSTNKAINTFRKQIKSLGISVDWDREVGSHNSDYYKWTQWFFLLFYKRGLAYRKKQSVNWCGSCQTVLANEQVNPDGRCERCETVVAQKEMEQWHLRITDYAARLLKDLDKVDWPEESKKRQRDWIGKSEGALVKFPLLTKERGRGEVVIEVFTTRPDTLFGATYIVLAPEGEYVKKLKDRIKNWKEVQKYIEESGKKTELDRQMQKEKTGVELEGVKAINPVNNEEIPIFVADYVLATYGTGAIMAVPAHDERDFEFAKKYGLPIQEVVIPKVVDKHDPPKEGIKTVFRNAVQAIVINPKNKKVLCLHWKKFPWTTFVTGGMDDGEDKIKSAKREILEETGYKNIKFMRQLGGPVESHFYANHKGENRKAHFCALVFELENEERDEVPAKEREIHDVVWMSWEEMQKDKNVKCAEYEIWLDRFFNRGRAFVDDGVSVNSDFLNNLSTPDAKEKMIQWLEEKGVGQRKTQYKLRDWSVSRQRFWGAPIPMLQSESVRHRTYNYVFIHGYGGSGLDYFCGWLKQELEKKGHTVYAPDLPNTDKPKALEQADYILQNTKINENTVIVAHSHGGPVAFRLLEKAGVKVAKVVLVDAVFKPEFNDCKRPAVEASDNYKFDFAKIKATAGEFVVIADSDYPIIPKEHHGEMRKFFDAKLVVAKPNDEHFCAEVEPVVLRESLVDGLKPIPEKDLPVFLPNDVDFKPTGESPLNYSKKFQRGVEKKYGKGWKREPDTLDTFMCSSWYYYRYLDPSNDKAFASPAALKRWMPVDFYLGGPEHVNGHLLYSRFFTKVLYDAGYIDFDEPFLKHRHQGLILGQDNRKMSKRWHNVINPTDVVNEYGADTCRMYEMFMGPLEDDKPWDMNGVKGVKRFLERVWSLATRVIPSAAPKGQAEGSLFDSVEILLHQTIKKVIEDIEALRFNTAISQMMILVNEMSKREYPISNIQYQTLLQLLSPFAPHITEELWSKLGNKKSIFLSAWPKYDPDKLQFETMKLAVQVNGKVRAEIEVATEAKEEEIKTEALANENVKKWLGGKEPRKIIYIKGRLVSVVL